MLPRSFLICILELLAVRGALGWKHVGRDEFKSITTENDLSLVAFVAPETPSSKALEPEWLSVTSQSSTPLVSIDCTSETTLCAEQGVISYPAIRLYRSKSEEVKRYRGPRKASSITSFLARVARPTVTDLTGRLNDELTAFKRVDTDVLIAYTPSLTNPDSLTKSFLALADRYSDRLTFAVTTDTNHVKSEDVWYTSIVCYKTQEGAREQYPDHEEDGIDHLDSWIKRVTRPLVGPFSTRNTMHYLKARKPILYFFTSSDETRAAYVKSITQLAKAYSADFSFVTVDTAEYGYMALTLGLQPGVEPAMAVLDPVQQQVFPFEVQGETIRPAAVDKFVTEILKGKRKPWGPDGDLEEESDGESDGETKSKEEAKSESGSKSEEKEEEVESEEHTEL
ncbi:protein disulfide-isomerase [Drepanopeziza brunnea f. sp. 'multigermtubi' MB_m1]|uniref:Protein disulfide-isomerase n=1 Tax=Marssonina brunnea f. sp. multigermtubi (strain MB_m1) TaxID=1072389 RepID=K1WL01_MARBU|nr:protein disulfide-isomerase [Drepanopeziza brunnea f. sp. 'multigermtubi' MB_m1]EKD12942.1 protein disulfide-isomerase [Drepanopeziza brunnea f. sp. 'multigermtubi' MB_m1]